MVRMDGAEARKQRYAQIAQKIQAMLYENKDQGFIPLKKTVVFFKVELGLTAEKIMECLNDLAALDQFEIDTEHDQIKKLRV